MTTAGFVRRAFMASLFLAILVPLLLFGASDSEATTFDPQYTITLANPRTGVNSDISADLTLLAPQVNFAALVAFTPPQFSLFKGADIPIGALVGELQSTATLGLINNNCLTPVFPNFNFMNASLNTADTIDPLASGTPDRLSNIAADANGNSIPDGADKWPSWLNNIFRTDENDPGTIITPRARLFAEFFLASASTTVILQTLVFEPGQTIDPPGPEPAITFNPALGYPSATVLQTLGDPTEAPSPSPITDFCTTLLTNGTAFGLTKDNPATGADEGGLVLRTNPAEAGIYDFTNYVVSQRDADEDGIENGMDPCPFSADPDWDPRTGDVPAFPTPIPGDFDRDGIPDSCDEEPNTQVGLLDADFDFYLNRGDNCPQVQNGINDITLEIQGPNNQLDTDLDGIGDECDPNPGTPDGHRHGGAGDELFVSTPVTVVAGAAGNTAPVCAGADVQLFENTASSPFDLLCSDADGDSLTCSVVDQGSKGTLDITDCNSATYTASPNATGADTVTYNANDGTDDSNTATVSVDIVPLVVGLNLLADQETVPIGGSTAIQAVCAEEQNGVQPVPGEDITFKIDSQPGSDADLDGQADVTKTSDAEGVAEATLNVGSTAGDIVVSADSGECGSKTITVAVEGAIGSGNGGGAGGGPDTGVGSLAPIAASIPAWAAIASGLGGAGLLGSLGALAARALRRRRS